MPAREAPWPPTVRQSQGFKIVTSVVHGHFHQLQGGRKITRSLKVSITPVQSRTKISKPHLPGVL